MRIGIALVLIAVGAILRFGVSTASTHGIAIHTIGDILMLVGILGVALWLVVWAPWARTRRAVYRREVPPDAVYRREVPPDAVYRREVPPDAAYRREVPPDAVYRREVPPDEVPPSRTYPADDPYEDEFRR